jgi:hypothetical protein
VSEIGVEGLSVIEESLSELSGRQASNARMVLLDIEQARRDARERGWKSHGARCRGAPGEAAGYEHAVVRCRDGPYQYAKSRNAQLACTFSTQIRLPGFGPTFMCSLGPRVSRPMWAKHWH